MSRYNQPYSEILKMPFKDAMFFLRLIEAENAYIKQEREKLKNKMKNKR